MIRRVFGIRPSCGRGRGLLAICVRFGLAGCSGPQPILYPNFHFNTVGRESAGWDIVECRKSAEAAGAEPGAGRAGEVAGGTAVGAGIGAAAGAVGARWSARQEVGPPSARRAGRCGDSSPGCGTRSRATVSRNRPIAASSIGVSRKRGTKCPGGASEHRAKRRDV